MVTSPSADTPTRRTGRATALGLVLLVLGTLLAFTGAGPLGSVAGAIPSANGGAMQSVADYATYPNSLPAGQNVPAGCAAYFAAGNTVLEGLNFTRDRGGNVVSSNGGDMVLLGNLQPGDVITMSWTGWRQGCETGVSLSVKAASAPFFEETTDQALIAFVGCNGSTDANCTVQGGGFAMSLTMPQAICNYQTDAVVGPPLDVIGPNGSYYSNGLRQANLDPAPANGNDMLIAANNGGSGQCAPPVVTDPICAAGGATLTVQNVDLLNTIRVDVLKDGVSIFPGGDVDPNLLLAVGPNSTSDPILIPGVPTDGPFQITVVAASQTIYDAEFPNDCTEPTASAEGDCQEGTITVTTANPGPQTATFVVTASDADGPLTVTDNGDGTYSIPTSDSDVTVVVTADGVEVLNTVIPSCLEPTATVDLDCQEGEIVVTTTQPSGDPVVFVVTATDDDGPVTVTDNGDGTFTIPTDGQVIDITVTVDGDEFLTESVEPCDEPVAATQLECESGTITITTTQPTDHDVTFVVTADGVEVPLDGDGVGTVPSGNGVPVHIVVTADGETVLEGDVPPCNVPSASAVVDCETGTITITANQPSDHTVAFVITANGTPLVLNGSTATAAIGDVPVEIVVTADGVELLRQTIQPCDDPEATITVVCSNNTITVTTTQPTDHTVDFVVTANGTPLTLTNGTASTAIGSSNVTVVVTADGTELARRVVEPCTEVLPNTQTRGTTSLPRTGGEDAGRLALALGLVVTGLGLVLFGEDRRLGLLLQKR